jgi:hypothetical protein
MHALLTVFLPAAFGSALQELLYWYDSRKKLSNKTYQAQLRSAAYWLIIIAMIIATGAGALIWFYHQDPAPKDCLLLGAAFPTLFKHAVSATARGPRMGDHVAPKSQPVWSYFTQKDPDEPKP